MLILPVKINKSIKYRLDLLHFLHYAARYEKTLIHFRLQSAFSSRSVSSGSFLSNSATANPNQPNTGRVTEEHYFLSRQR